MAEPRVGLMGATSLVGGCLLAKLEAGGRPVAAFSREEHAATGQHTTWHRLGATSTAPGADIPQWICAAPVWVLPGYFDLLLASGARRVVALSSTSRYTKQDSADIAERTTAARLVEGEAKLQQWAERHGIEWVILRPTLIYGYGRDGNVSEIARFIRRFGFFPVLGKAGGLRQPVHADDVAAACLAALASPAAANRGYDISGGETLGYRELVRRVFAAQGLRPRIVQVPLGLFALAVRLLHMVPRYRHWTASMAQRMNRDLVFSHADAARDLGYAPRAFLLRASELP